MQRGKESSSLAPLRRSSGTLRRFQSHMVNCNLKSLKLASAGVRTSKVSSHTGSRVFFFTVVLVSLEERLVTNVTKGSLKPEKFYLVLCFDLFPYSLGGSGTIAIRSRQATRFFDAQLQLEAALLLSLSLHSACLGGEWLSDECFIIFIVNKLKTMGQLRKGR